MIVLVWTFRTSGSLANAYGIAVTGVMVVTSILAFVVFWKCWHWSLWLSVLVVAPLLLLEFVFLGSNLLKVLAGGYVPLGIAAFVSLLMWTWIRGSKIAVTKARRESIALDDLTRMLERSKPMRAKGTAVYLTSDTQIAPSALMHNLKHNGVLHERNIIMTVLVENTPRVPLAERVRIEPISELFSRVFLTFGYMEEPNVPKAMTLAKKKGLKFEIMSTSFFLSRRAFRATAQAGMPLWQDRLYISMAMSAADSSGFYCLPTNRVVEMGQQFTI